MSNPERAEFDEILFPRATARRIFELTGEDYLRSIGEIIVKDLNLGLDYAFVGELTGPQRIRTISMFAQDRFIENVEYDLEGTPCNFVVGRELCVYPRGVQELFPDDAVLAEMGAHSYMGVPLFSSNGRPLGLIAALGRLPIPAEREQHITGILQVFGARAAAELERMHAEKELKESEANLRTILESVYDAVIIHNPDGTIIDVNRKMLELYGVDREQALRGATIKDFSAPDNPFDRLPGIWTRVLAGEEQIFEWKAKRLNDGFVFDVEVFLRAMSFQQKQVILATVRDITERKRAEEALKLTQFSIDHASVSVFMVDRAARFFYINKQACITLGYACEELRSMTVHDIDPDFPASVWESHWEQLKQAGSLHFETAHRKKNGILLPVDLTLNYVAFGGREYNVAFAQDISERKRVESELTRSYNLTKTIIDSMNDAVSLIDVRDFTIAGANRVFLENYGYANEAELEGKHCYEITHHRPDVCSAPDDICPLVETVRTKEHFSVDHVHYDREGNRIYVEVSTSPIRDEAGNVVQVVHVQRNITERKKAEEALRISESRFRGLFRQSSISMQLLGPDGRTIEVNHAFEDLWGLKPDALKDYNIFTDAELAAKGIMPYIQKGFSGEAVEIPIVRYDPVEINRLDRARWVKAFIYPVKTGEGSVHQVVLMHWDVTEMVSAQEALRRNEELLRSILETIPVGVFVADKAGRLFMTNSMSRKIWGGEHLVPVERYGEYKGWWPDTGKRIESYEWTLARALETGKTIMNEVIDIECFDGTRKTILNSALPLRDERGNITGGIAVNQDITESKRLERELQESRNFLRNVMKSVTNTIFVLDQKERFTELNEAVFSLTGYLPRELQGKTFDVLFDREAAEKIREIYTRITIHGESVSDIETGLIRKSGEKSIVTFSAAPLREDGHITGVVGAVQDITERKKMEEAIKHLAHHDSLTGLPNRRLFREVATLEMAQARRHGERIVVLFLDLDRFKEVNDTLGHEIGDLLLKETASRLKAVIRTSDTIARIGGDEFNIIISDVGYPEYAAEVARKILTAVRVPFIIKGK